MNPVLTWIYIVLGFFAATLILADLKASARRSFSRAVRRAVPPPHHNTTERNTR